MTEQQAIEAAKAHVLETFTEYAYPIPPTDEWGNELDYEPGCVPWVRCTGIWLKGAFSTDVDEHFFTISVFVDLEWNEEGEEVAKEIDSCFEVWVPVDGNPDSIELQRVS